MPITGRSLEIASSTSLTDFLRPTSMGMIDPGNRTEFRKGRMEMTSGTSTGPSGTGFFVAMVRSYTREVSSASQGEARRSGRRRVAGGRYFREPRTAPERNGHGKVDV